MFKAKIICYLCTLLIGVLLAGKGSLFDHQQEQSIKDNNVQFEQNFLQVLRKIQLQKNFNYILIIKEPLTDCIFDGLLRYLNVPWLIMTNFPDVNLLQTNSKEMITIWCVGLLSFAKENNEFLYVRHVIFLQPFETAVLICFSISIEIGNIQHIMLSEDSMRNQMLYYCDPVTRTVAKQIILHPEQNESIFPNDYYNMHDRNLITQSNLLPPYNILYEDQFGRRKLEGYVGNCVKTYAKRHNGHLDIMSTGNVSHYKELFGYVIQGLTDMPSIVIPLGFEGLSSKFSYPLEFVDECFMIPMPRAKPINELFFNVFQWNVMFIIVLLSMIYAVFLSIGKYNSVRQLGIIDVVFSDKSIRGLLGQSFVMPLKMNAFMKYVYLLIFYTNLMVMTFYTAYLQSSLISPPLENKIKNLEDIRQAGLKIAVHPRDLEDWDYSFYKNYQDILFVTSENYSEFKNLRDSMDLRYVYPVAYPSWTIYQEQQKLFQRKLFFYSSDLCISRMVLFSIPIRANLPYREKFNQHLLDVRDTGLLQHWFNEVFITLIRLKLLSFKDLSTPNTYDGLVDWDDLYWIWLSYCMCMLFALAVFVVELMAYVRTYFTCNY